MPWNESTKILTAPFTKIAANGQGDLQKALSSSLMSQIRLFTETNINPMAKYKPFRNATVLFESNTARDTARANTRYGFGVNLPILALYGSVPQADWQYLKPRGGGYNEPFRAFDFIKTAEETQVGYDKEAVAPIAIWSSEIQLGQEGGMHILVFGNAGTNNYRNMVGDTKRWYADRSLSLQELLERPSDFYNAHYIAFVVWDNNTNTCNYIRTNKTFKNLADAGSAPILFDFYAEAQTISGITYPAVPILADTTRSGHTFTVIVCCSSSGASGSAGYEVESSSPQLYTPYSLGFVNGCDRLSMEAQNYESILGLVASINSGPSLTFVRHYDSVWDEYELSGSISGTFTTPSPWRVEWVSIETTLLNQMGLIGDAPYDTTGEYIHNSYVNLPSYNSTYNRIIVDTAPHVFFPRSAGLSSRYITVSARAYNISENVPFSNTITINATS